MVKYIYDAWGNFAIEQSSNCNQSAMQLGYLNPYRYRGYYYDSETNLYYLQTRYYDPEIGRFISQDNIDYADPEMISGLNLYAYCGNNPVMTVDPTGKAFLSLLIAGLIGATVAAVSSAVIQKVTTGTVNLAQVGISALFGAVGGMLSFAGIGGVIGQFAIQGTLAVGEMYSIAALNGSASSIGFAQVAATFLFAGALGAIGSKNATSEFKRIGQIENSFLKYSIRDIKSNGAPIFVTLLKWGAKYFKEFFVPLVKKSAIMGGITAIANIGDYWIQEFYNKIH